MFTASDRDWICRQQLEFPNDCEKSQLDLWPFGENSWAWQNPPQKNECFDKHTGRNDGKDAVTRNWPWFKLELECWNEADVQKYNRRKRLR